MKASPRLPGNQQTAAPRAPRRALLAVLPAPSSLRSITQRAANTWLPHIRRREIRATGRASIEPEEGHRVSVERLRPADLRAEFAPLNPAGSALESGVVDTTRAQLRVEGEVLLEEKEPGGRG